jgi:hypothetical protein
MERSTSAALRCIADLLDRLPGLPTHIVTVYSDSLQIGVLFGAGTDDEARRAAVRRVLALLDATPEAGPLEYGGRATLGPYVVEVSTGFD